MDYSGYFVINNLLIRSGYKAHPENLEEAYSPATHCRALIIAPQQRVDAKAFASAPTLVDADAFLNCNLWQV